MGFDQYQVDPAGARYVVVADLDSDGDLDIVSASSRANRVRWYESTVTGYAMHEIEAAVPDVRSVCIADLDNDGALDIISASEGDGTIRWHRSNGALPPTFTTTTVHTGPAGQLAVIAADLDQDGHTDLLTASWGDDTIRWLRHSGAPAPTFNSRVLYADADNPSAIVVADLDGDDDLDVASVSASDDAVRWHEQDSGSFVTHLISSGPLEDGVQSIAAGDLNGDGRIDLATAAGNADTIRWFENNGGDNPEFAARTAYSGADGARSVIIADLDRDGFADLASAADFDNSVRWHRHDTASSPTFATFVVQTSAIGNPFAVFAADLDGDHDLDLVSASEDTGDGVWLYTNTLDPCVADLTGDGALDTNDFFLFLTQYGTGNSLADFFPDGVINTNDFFAFLTAYQAGCP